MHRSKILSLIKKYKPFDEHEKQMSEQIIEFVNREKNCFDNSNSEGHVTASGWVFDPKASKVCLVHHSIFNRWLQPGGHSDGNSDTPNEALRECREELGIDSLKLSSEEIFDIDVHRVSADKKRNLPEHFHFDVRFLVLGDSKIQPVTSDESNDVMWMDLDKILELNNEESIRRMVEKTKLL